MDQVDIKDGDRADIKDGDRAEDLTFVHPWKYYELTW